MIADALITAGYAAPTIAASGAAAYYRHQAKKLNKPVKVPNPATASEADMIKAGWEAVEQITRDIHALYHPVGCKCAMCELRADDDPHMPDPEGPLCANPCFGCTVLTCKSHPDHVIGTKNGSHGEPEGAKHALPCTIHWYENGRWKYASGKDGIYGCNVKGCGKSTGDMYIDGSPQKKVWCADHWKWGMELPKPAPNPKAPAQKRAAKKASYEDCPTHRKGGCVCKQEGMVPCDRAETVSDARETDVQRLKTAIKNLEDQLSSLGAEHTRLAEENEGLKKLLATLRHENRDLHEALGHTAIEQFGEREPVRYDWGDRQLGSLFRKCVDCGEKAFREINGEYYCQKCVENMQRVVSDSLRLNHELRRTGPGEITLYVDGEKKAIKRVEPGDGVKVHAAGGPYDYEIDKHGNAVLVTFPPPLRAIEPAPYQYTCYRDGHCEYSE